MIRTCKVCGKPILVFADEDDEMLGKFGKIVFEHEPNPDFYGFINRHICVNRACVQSTVDQMTGDLP